MARTVSQIKAQLVEYKEANTTLSALTSVSNAAIWSNFLDVIAISISVFEQLIDAAKTDVETNIRSASPNSEGWMRSEILKFQYDANNPQTPTIGDDYKITYATINEDYQILTRCSVKTELDRTVSVKVAKSEPPTALVTAEANALLGYVEAFGVPGIVYELVSLEADKVYLDADIYFDSIFGAVISDDVIAAIDAFFASLSEVDFDGVMYVAKLQDAIQNVEGVIDVNLNEIRCRKDTVAFGSATIVYKLSTGVNLRTYNPASGYLLGETTASNTLADTLNFVPQ
jgi:hypothetical protein